MTPQYIQQLEIFVIVRMPWKKMSGEILMIAKYHAQVTHPKNAGEYT